MLILFIGIYIYMRSTCATRGIGRYGFIGFAVVMFVIQASQFFTPPPPSANTVAISALFAYVLFTGTAAWLERKRVLASKSASAS